MATPATIRMDEPEEKLFRIGEVSRLTGIKAFVLRYWEQEIPALQPVKTPTGHRLYRREDIETVLEIKRLLYDEGFTLAGARKHLSEARPESAPAQQNSQLSLNDNCPAISPAPPRPVRFSKARQQTLAELREELLAILTLLEGQ